MNHPDANSDALLSCGQVAAMFRVTPRTVAHWADNGQLHSTRSTGVTVASGSQTSEHCSPMLQLTRLASPSAVVPEVQQTGSAAP
jgi:hypothetical protein